MENYFKKYLKNKYSEEDLKETVSMLNGEKDESVVSNNMHEHWNTVSDNTDSNLDDKFRHILDRIHHHINQNKVETPTIIRLYRGFAKVAAILLFPLLFAFTYYLVVSTNTDQVSIAVMHVPNGITSDIILPDGTLVKLNSGSTLKYPSTFRGQKLRNVELNGEGYFQVVSDKHHPFIVKTNKIGVKVLGTTFNVKAYEDDPNISVALLEGSVKLIEYHGNESKDLRLLKPGEIANLDKSQNKLRVLNSVDLNRNVSWKDGKMIFDNEPFDAVLRHMARKYNVEYEITDKRVLEYRITATFINEVLEDFLKKLSLCSSLKYEIKEGLKKSDGSYTKKKVVIY